MNIIDLAKRLEGRRRWGEDGTPSDLPFLESLIARRIERNHDRRAS